MATTGGPNTVTDGLVLALDAASKRSYQSGTTWSDLSGGGYDGTLSVAGIGSVSGSLNTMAFNGVDNNVEVDKDATSIGSLGSVEAWVYLKEDKWMYFYYRGYNSENSLFLGYHSAAAQWFFGTYESATYTYNYWGDTGYSYYGDKWHHVVMTYDASLGSDNWKFYHNGVNRHNKDYTEEIGTNNYTPHLGSTSRYWNGNISIFNIYDRALSASEILQNYNAIKSRFGLT